MKSCTTLTIEAFALATTFLILALVFIVFTHHHCKTQRTTRHDAQVLYVLCSHYATVGQTI